MRVLRGGVRVLCDKSRDSIDASCAESRETLTEPRRGGRERERDQQEQQRWRRQQQ